MKFCVCIFHLIMYPSCSHCIVVVCVCFCMCLHVDMHSSVLHAYPQGSVCEDWTTVYCCYPLAVCQMIREMKWRMKTQTYHVSTTLECSWRNSKWDLFFFSFFQFIINVWRAAEITGMNNRRNHYSEIWTCPWGLLE